MKVLFVLSVVMVISTTVDRCWAAHRPALASTHGMVAADSPIASRVGAELLAQGGDAVDAAVATAFARGVVHPFASGIGGGGFAIVHRHGGSALALDFREMAPQASTRDMYLDNQGNVIPHASTQGARAIGVPGELAGLADLHRRYGKLPWAQVVQPAIKLARNGFTVSPMLHDKIKVSLPALKGSAIADSLINASGEPHLPGSLMRLPHLAFTLERIATHGAKDFYEGSLAKELVTSIQSAGGLITAEDLRNYAIKVRPVLRANVLGHEVLAMPPPSSGGLVIIQVLASLNGLKLSHLGHNTGAYLHRLTEAFKHAFADRAKAMGDPDFHPIRHDDFIGPKAIHRVRQSFDPDKTYDAHRYGALKHNGADGGTSHLSVVDKKGNAVALTTTINTGFGSRFVAGKTGIILNNEMDDFVAQPGVPNAFGLIGNAANAIEAGKRPLSSMSPTIVLAHDYPKYVLGGSGGPTIITGTIQVLLNMLVFGMSPRQAVEAPRIHHQWMPHALMAEPGINGDVVAGLEKRGHIIENGNRFGAVQAIFSVPGQQFGASDPSKGGRPAGVGAGGRVQQLQFQVWQPE